MTIEISHRASAVLSYAAIHRALTAHFNADVQLTTARANGLKLYVTTNAGLTHLRLAEEVEVEQQAGCFG